ncbi:hypothetical protein TTHERM_00703760 (macronuclear) [Tetrahymena thermophila SB210]|uniref:Uncharacterized protein n=1 Tax=Tetrahymena thermophila (strain SB210) TaxID=312017 RepID=Q22GE7_TETTS|nr:hypothetical protein TTHERM_00703760 [Tetrahymena thermophila SB210]EAR84384.1 hypothetical protein TTHERM_00703760 [Tetrahymena thermophila SB210]|eukprot:XP_001032047.1 hypothetical protein TTHERM_00703760 [Tetrahymena thermophila SB210]
MNSFDKEELSQITPLLQSQIPASLISAIQDQNKSASNKKKTQIDQKTNKKLESQAIFSEGNHDDQEMSESTSKNNDCISQNEQNFVDKLSEIRIENQIKSNELLTQKESCSIINPNCDQPTITIKSDQQYPSCLNQLQQKYKSILDFNGITSELIQNIGNEIIRLTTEWQGKNINTLNKQFQNSVMNYFLECYVSELLVGDFQVEFKRDVFKQLTSKMEREEGSQLKKRYITLLNYFLESLQEKRKISGYVELLLNIIHENIQAEKDTIDYQTQYRKKMTALLLLEHCLHPDRKTKFTDFYSLWSHVFSFCPLKRKKSKTSEGKPRRAQISHLQNLNNSQSKYLSKVYQKNLVNSEVASSQTCAAFKEIPLLPALTIQSSQSMGLVVNSVPKNSLEKKFFESIKDSLPNSQQSLTMIQKNIKKQENDISPKIVSSSLSNITQNQLDHQPFEERSKAQSRATISNVNTNYVPKNIGIKHEDDCSNSLTQASSIYKSPKTAEGNLIQQEKQKNNINFDLQIPSLNAANTQYDLLNQGNSNNIYAPELRKQIKTGEINQSQVFIPQASLQISTNQLLQQQSQLQQTNPFLQNTIMMSPQQLNSQFLNQQIGSACQVDMNQVLLQNIQMQQLQQNPQLMNQLKQQSQVSIPQQLLNINYPVNLSVISQQQQQQQQQNYQIIQTPLLHQMPNLVPNQQIFQFQQQLQQQTQQQQQWPQQQQTPQVIHDVISNEIIVLNPQTMQYVRYQPKQEMMPTNPQINTISINQTPQSLFESIQSGIIGQQSSPQENFAHMHLQLQKQQQQQNINQFYQ